MQKPRKRPILGLTETVLVLGRDKQKRVRARIDSGATKSSLDMQLAQELGLPVFSSTVVKSASGSRLRPVARARVRIKGVDIITDFTLAERGHMTYPVLIGHNILKKGRFLIDPQKP